MLADSQADKWCWHGTCLVVVLHALGQAGVNHKPHVRLVDAWGAGKGPL